MTAHPQGGSDKLNNGMISANFLPVPGNQLPNLGLISFFNLRKSA
jgi:hypothetical protein